MTQQDPAVHDLDPAARVRELTQRGIAEAQAGERIAAVATLKEAEQVASDAGLTSAAIAAHINRGWALWYAGEVEGALVLYAEGAQMAREIGDADRLRSALSNLGIAYGRLGRHAESLAAYEEYLPFVSDDLTASAEAHLNCGSALASLGRADEALAHLERAERLATGAGLTGPLVMIYLNRGFLSESAGNPDAAFEFFWKAFDTAEETQDADLIGTVTNALGRAYVRAGDDSRGADCFGEAERAFRSLGDDARLADALQQHAAALQRVGLGDQALAAWDEAESIWRELGDDAALAESIFGQALVLAVETKSPNVDLRFADAGDLYRRANLPERLAEVRHAHAQWLREQEMDRQALDRIRQAMEAAAEAGNGAIECRARGLYATMLADTYQFEAAARELEAAGAQAEANGDRDAVMGLSARRAYVMAREGASLEDVIAQVEAALEQARALEEPRMGEQAIAIVIDEIRGWCDDAYHDRLGEWRVTNLTV